MTKTSFAIIARNKMRLASSYIILYQPQQKEMKVWSFGFWLAADVTKWAINSETLNTKDLHRSGEGSYLRTTSLSG